MVSYKGPIAKGSGEMPQIIRVPLRARYTVSSGAAGFIETYLNTTNAFNAPEFANYAAIWREYRVLGIRFEYAPWYDSGGYIGSTNALSIGYAAPYHGPPPAFQGAVTTNTDLAVLQMDGSKKFHPGKPLVVEWRMGDVEEAQYFSTSVSYNVGGIYATVPSVTASRSYGTTIATILVEFKGRV